MGQLLYEICDKMTISTPCYLAEIDLRALTKYYGKSQRFTPLPKYPEEKRDLCFVMDKDLTCGALEDAIRKACPAITQVDLFDVYEGIQLGPNRKSMAFSVVFTPTDHAFASEEVDGYVSGILSSLHSQFGITLRE